MVDGMERCLYVSTFALTPSQSSSLPVVFHVHHGQFLYGFKTELGEVKAIVQKQILVSNANFRLGAFGFFAHPDIQTNVGQQDLLQALTWVRNHICNLGGNPFHVTVTGSSSGASQVLLMLASKSAVGLFRGAWINSPTAFGISDFFSQDVPYILEQHSKIAMRAVGCGSLKCMRQLPYKKLLLRLLDAESPLVVLSPRFLSKIGKDPLLAFDNVVVPNMLEAACTQSMANSQVSLVVGQSKDELDTLKFQFPLKQIIGNIVDVSMQRTHSPDRPHCLQTKLLTMQGAQETVEDYFFGLSSYLVGTQSQHGTNPRWHFLVSAPGSISHRAWHTSAELLSWGVDINEDTQQYHHVTKRYMLANVQEQLRLYAQSNFIHFVRHNRPQDAGWMQTVPSPAGEIGGLPSKLWDQTPLQGRITWEQHHSNKTIGSLHKLMCDPQAELSGKNLDVQNCRMESHSASDGLTLQAPNSLANSQPGAVSPTEQIRSILSATKKSDFDLNVRMLKDLPEILRSLDSE
jgi:carboxylesterase type B